MTIAEEHRWPCEQCGADLRFAPGQTELKCDHCGHVQAIKAAPPRSRQRALGELDLAHGLDDDLPEAASVEVRSTSCPNCGAVVEFQGANHATECPFCATPVAIDTGSPRKGRAMACIYAPYWTFDADSDSHYRGQRGEHYYETRTVSVVENGKTVQRQEQVQKTRWYNVSGHVDRQFDDVLVVGSTSLPERLADNLSSWDLGALEPYSTDFLAGFQAEGYTVGLADGHAKARDKMEAVIREDVRRDIGGDEQRIDSIDSTFSDETFKHILLPVWMAAYKYGGKSYRFLVNGQTGEVRGERPYSWWKIGFAVAAGLVAAAGVAYLVDPSIFGLPKPDWMN